MTSIAYDGAWFYLARYAEGRFYKKKSAGGDLHQLTTLPIRTQDVIALLSGKVPMIDPASAELRHSPPGDGFLLLLRSGWLRRRYENIYLAADMKTVWKYEVYHGKNHLIYEAEMTHFKTFEGYRIPQQIEFRDQEGNRLLLEIERYWPNVDVEPSLFILKKPQ